MKLYYRIATSEAGLAKGYFFARKLPPPDLLTFADYSVRRSQSTGGEARHGYGNGSILWNQLTAEQADIIKGLITAAEVTGGVGNGTLYLTIPRTDAGFTWIDINGIAIMPDWQPERQTDGAIYTNVLLRLNNCEILNEPSTAL